MVVMLVMVMMAPPFPWSRLLCGGGRYLPRKGGEVWEGLSEVVGGVGDDPRNCSPCANLFQISSNQTIARCDLTYLMPPHINDGRPYW